MVENEKLVFNDITAKLCQSNRDIGEGKMMSSPGINYKNKVFAFYHDKEMIFKLGKGYDIESEGVYAYKFLNPFKNKPPMKGWFVVSATEVENWQKLADIAMNIMISQIKKVS
ncbi:MAG: hypothetical protein GPJ54_08155 [Candidatus Heimdallarchaeota archaeon]|nr:hypothetical protein [Candidatus Heimdallarchaeota archaeon]